jgi:hypothetical protein
VNCSASDTGGNIAHGSFTVTVNDVDVPGRMRGDGFVDDNGTRDGFSFQVREKVPDIDRGNLIFSTDRGRTHHRFETRAITFVAFSDDPAFKAGHKKAPTIDTVRFSGIGEWNGQAGYTFDVFATDQGEPGQRRDTFSITIRNRQGVVVASVSGTLDGGNIQSERLPGRH